MHTNYNGAAKTANEAVLVPRAFFDRRLFGGSRLTEDITLYPSLKSTGDYRLHSETVLSNPINEQLSLKFSLVKDYNSEPPAGKKKSDSQILSSLNYSF
jgi:putative salt-induced outer membrane protein YdiY